MIVAAGTGFKLATAGGFLLGGVAIVTGAASSGTHLSDLAHQPDTVATICDYAGSGPTGSPSGAPRGTASGGLGLDAGQLSNARAIIDTANQLSLPDRAAVIAIATALQESDLGHDLTGDHGTSFGLFHQKPTSGYGTRTQILDPHHAARAFYARLTHLDGWQRLPLTQAAQAIQKSASPGAYAHQEGRATQIVRTLSSAPGPPGTFPTDDIKDRITTGLVLTAARKLPRDQALTRSPAHSAIPPTNPAPTPSHGSFRTTPPNSAPNWARTRRIGPET